MLSRLSDPIIAIATSAGRAAVGIVRVSGPDLGPLIEALCGRTLTSRRAAHLAFMDAHGEPIDKGLALYFPSPHSYTGESVLELQAHGGTVVLQLLLARCLEAATELVPTTGQPRLARLRLADAGEFTQRAYLNGKLDLAQAEAVSDLIDASTEAAARSATRSLSGVFSREIEQLRERLVKLRMLVEATLDFPEEEIDFLQKADAIGQLARIEADVASVLSRATQGALLRDGITVVIAGQPNVGKSSLLNALAGAELAIVTSIAGTTRDRISQTIQIEGVPLHVVDTAGLRRDEQEADEVERIGMARSWEAIGQADAVIFVHDLSRRGDEAYEEAEAKIADRLPTRLPVLHVDNKVDAVASAGHRASISIATHRENEAATIRISARSGFGLIHLRAALLRLAGWQSQSEGVFIARARHVDALRRTGRHLELARQFVGAGSMSLDLLAEELRLAHDALGEITGVFTADDLLGEIFSRFCIGK
ncbi:MAG: tRNA uridine-5-carboxymethylaminomethyl(34) synthesis GTPase MnmE [Rhizobacter sp.]|nr:tRNA uridine-5-carboxymethylaminomethyl(34) synthesis GTPase MnmE [Rhizobacter sp.]